MRLNVNAPLAGAVNAYFPFASVVVRLSDPRTWTVTFGSAGHLDLLGLLSNSRSAQRRDEEQPHPHGPKDVTMTVPEPTLPLQHVVHGGALILRVFGWPANSGEQLGEQLGEQRGDQLAIRQQPDVSGIARPGGIRRRARVQLALPIIAHLGERLVGVHVVQSAQLPFARLGPASRPPMIGSMEWEVRARDVAASCPRTASGALR
jgi:hypothetical protein